MNEFHGWIVIREKYYGDTIDWSNQCSVLGDIGKKVEDFYFDDCCIELKKMYDSYHLIVTGETKRKGPEVEAVYELFRYISVIAPGSYGLLYTRDEYDEFSYKFKVYRIAKGKFEEKQDVLLSPCIPVIEE